jgi:PAS domain S-box-containing protein
MDAVRLLLIEDSEDDAVLVVNRLRRAGIDLTWQRVETGETMASALRDQRPDIIISDNSMPRFNAEEALRLLRDSGLDIPFIVVSGQIGEESAAALMRAGAHDFVLKGNLARLEPAIHRELREAQERIRRDEVQATLHTTEEQFRLLAEHLRDVIFKYRLVPTPALEYISPAIAGLNGHHPAELYDDPERLLDTVDPDDRDELRRSWHAPPGRPLVFRWNRPDGTLAWVEQRLIPVRDQDGRLTAVEGILRDVTDQIRAAREREDLAFQLHQAERLDSLGQLAGGIAHDFNNLLSVISSYNSFVLEGLDPAHPCYSDAERVAGAAHRAAALANQLLIFSRLEPSRPEDVDLNAVVTGIELLLRRTIGEDIAFVIHTDPGIDHVTIDRTRLEQLIVNLVVNARAAMPQGGRLTIDTAAVDHDGIPTPEINLPAGRFVRLTVTDTGCGMDTETKRRAFEPFFTTKSPGNGTGLGLSTVYGVVKEADGVLTLWSEPGEGTRFTIYLPSAATLSSS